VGDRSTARADEAGAAQPGYDADGQAQNEDLLDGYAHRVAHDMKTRRCLVCRTPFPSEWAGERICRQCKSKAAWRSGSLGS
jgi:hypothetical protein